MSDSWRWFGHVGHLCVGHWCRFHLTTHVGHYLVSTLGEYVPDEQVRNMLAQIRGIQIEGRGDARLYDWLQKCGFEEIGYDRVYESMVFPAGKPCHTRGCGCGLPEILHPEADFAGYLTPAAATLGHYELCKKWANEPQEMDTRTGEEAREEFRKAASEMMEALTEEQEEVIRDLSQDLPEELKEALRRADFDDGSIT